MYNLVFLCLVPGLTAASYLTTEQDFSLPDLPVPAFPPPLQAPPRNDVTFSKPKLLLPVPSRPVTAGAEKHHAY